MTEEFRKLFGSAEGLRTFRAPGRVNLIGEHTDYNLGFVMPVALDLATTVAVAPSADGRIRMYSEGKQEMREWNAEEFARLERQHHWSDYPVGVAHELAKAGYGIAGANLLIRSTVPEGSGLSSSAALEVSSALAFLRGRSLDKLELARLCQRAEIQFVGMPCGIMDQYISIFGQEGAAIEIDCRSLENRPVTLPTDIVFVAVNTMVKHALSGSAYKERVQECAEAVTRLKQRFPQTASLRDITPEQFESAAELLPDTIRRRARHVVTEDARVEAFVAAAAAGDLARMGKLMVESHASLRDDYEVSCAELDFLVEAALGIEGVCGSRMTGGGFGGCTVTMLRPESAHSFRETIAQRYQARFGVIPDSYLCRPSAGAGEIGI